MTFEQFLRTHWEMRCIDYILKCYNDGTQFYVIPDRCEANQSTPRYQAVGNLLVPIGDEEKMENEQKEVLVNLSPDTYDFLSCLVKRRKFANIESAINWIVEEWTNEFFNLEVNK